MTKSVGSASFIRDVSVWKIDRGIVVGDRGFNAGGFAYMPRVKFPLCGLTHSVSNRNYAAGRFECGGVERCQERQRKRRLRERLEADKQKRKARNVKDV